MERYLERLLIDSQGNQLTCFTRRSCSHNDVLLSADRIGHWHSCLALAQVYRRENLPGALVMSSEY